MPEQAGIHDVAVVNPIQAARRSSALQPHAAYRNLPATHTAS
jgi:hypothetical protein